jgi:integrase
LPRRGRHRPRLKERFQFRDLRAKSASDDTAQPASKRLGHADPKITERVYRRKTERAKPLR